MLKIAGCLIAVLAGLAVVSGVVLAVFDRPPSRIDLTVVGCDGVTVTYGRTGDLLTVSVRAAACHAPDRTALASERASFNALGAAAWRTSGPALGSVALTLGRSADRPDGQAPPRTLVVTGEQAAALWGPRPGCPGTDSPLPARAALSDIVWSAGFGAAVLSCGVAAALAARALRGAGMVAIWWR